MEHLIQPYVDACMKVFKELAGYEPSFGKSYVSTRNDIAGWDISGVIQISGEAQGIVVMSMKKMLALKIAGRLTGLDYQDFDEDVLDGIGEMVNIIAGTAKQGLEEYRLKTSLPEIVRGAKYYEVWKTFKSRIISIPFTIDSEIFCLSVSLQTGKAA